MNIHNLSQQELISIGQIVANALSKKNAMQIYAHLSGLSIQCKFNNNNTHRYLLVANNPVNKNGKVACAIMLNPSYANNIVADKSVNFLEQFVLENKSDLGYFSKLNIVNLFSEIETTDFQPNQTSNNETNDQYINDVISESDIILIAWGSPKNSRVKERASEVLSWIQNLPGKKVYKTKKHPSLGVLKNDFITNI